MVKQFNQVLEQRVRESKKFLWLDFFSSLLVDDGSKLNPDYALDGTHMNPNYLKLVESSMDRLAQ